jgi:hypothetical protein
MIGIPITVLQEIWMSWEDFDFRAIWVRARRCPCCCRAGARASKPGEALVVIASPLRTGEQAR